MTLFTGGPRRRDISFLEEFSVPTGEVASSFATDALNFSPTSSVIRAQEQLDAQEGELSAGGFIGALDDPLAGTEREQPVSEVLSMEAQQERIETAQVPISPVEGMRAGTLDLLISRKQEELARQSVTSRASGGQLVVGFGAGVMASLFDPINVVSAFVPVIAPAKYVASIARQTTRTGRALVRARIGAVEGAVGAILVEPIVSAQARNEQADYTLADTFMNIAFGTALGGGLHMGFGAIGDAIKARKTRIEAQGPEARARDALDAKAREDAFRADLALALDDRNAVPIIHITDLAANPRLADAGLTDPGSPAGFRIEFDHEKIHLNGEVIEPDIEAIARHDDPALFQEVDRLRTEQNSLRGELGELAGPRQRLLEETVAPIDAEINTLHARLKKANRKNAKKIQAKIDDLEARKADALAEGAATDTPEMTAARTRLQNVDLQLRDLAVDVAERLRTAETVASGQSVRRKPSRDVERFKARGAVVEDEILDLARFAQTPENLRLVSFETLDERLEKFSGQDDRLDANAAQAETEEILAEIDAFDQQVGDTRLSDQVKDLVAAENDNVNLAESHADALSAAFACRAR